MPLVDRMHRPQPPTHPFPTRTASAVQMGPGPCPRNRSLASERVAHAELVARHVRTVGDRGADQGDDDDTARPRLAPSSLVMRATVAYSCVRLDRL